MNSENPTDYAPLSYGAGLALGLLIILGLPSESSTTSTPAIARKHPEGTAPHLVAATAR
jgi:hypothetical protein